MLQVIAFFQDGCMACQEQEPINREVETALNIHIEAIDPLKERTYIDEYNLRVTPTIVIIKDGKVAGRFEGVVHREQLEDAIRNLL
jgi:thioredoxin 1